MGCLVDLDFSAKPIGRDVLKGDLLLVEDVHDRGGSHDQLEFLQQYLSGLHKHVRIISIDLEQWQPVLKRKLLTR